MVCCCVKMPLSLFTFWNIPSCENRPLSSGNLICWIPAFAGTTSREFLPLALQKNSFGQVNIKIFPRRVHFLDQFYLPSSFPLFYLFFPYYCRFNTFALLIIHQHMHVVSLCETLNAIIFMFPHTTKQVIRHPIIQSAVRFAREDI